MGILVQPSRFSAKLLAWWHEHKRDLPWKSSKDPYSIWVSEIILQQTRVVQGKKYFERFMAEFPTIQSLAAAPEDLLLKTWEGLGYYNRARNMHVTAKYLVENNQGMFPDTLQGLLQLKGIGPYTAAAIASFSFGLPHPVIDGNVLRLVTRVRGITSDIQQPSTVKEIQQYLDQAITFASPADFNQALMDFGSLVCTPGRPNCQECVLSQYCRAFQEEKTTEIPVKKKKQPLGRRFFHFLDIEDSDGHTLIHQRNSDEIWPRLFQLPLLETAHECVLEEEDLGKFLDSIMAQKSPLLSPFKLIAKSSQILSHQKIHGNFYKLKVNKLNIIKNTDLYLVEREKVSKFAFPKLISEYLSSDIYSNRQRGEEIKEKGENVVNLKRIK